MKRRRLVMKVPDREQFSALNGLGSLANQYAIHEHVAADREVLHGEFMFGGNAGNQRVRGSRMFDRLTLFQISERDQDVIAGVELQDLFLHSRNRFAVDCRTQLSE